MRKFLIKLFVGDYTPSIGNKRLAFPRASVIIMPLIIACGLESLRTFPIYESVIGIILLNLLLISIWFGFIHFWIWPAKWEELDKGQKWQLGTMSWSSNSLTEEQRFEWLEINKEYQGY